MHPDDTPQHPRSPWPRLPRVYDMTPREGRWSAVLLVLVVWAIVGLALWPLLA